jgi:hypothetical protein
MELTRSHVAVAVGCAAYLAAVASMAWQGGLAESRSGLLWAAAGFVWLFGSVLVGARVGAHALWLPIVGVPVGILVGQANDDFDNELRVLNWLIVFTVSIVLVAIGVWAWVRRQRVR